MFWRRKKDANEEWMAGASTSATTITSVNGGTPQVQVMGNATQEQVKQAMEMAERFMGQDLDGDGVVAGAQEDVVSQLERLAKLRDQGALTEEEFAAQKAKLLS